MGFLDSFKADRLGQKAYNTHKVAIEMQNRGKLSESRDRYAEAYGQYVEAYNAGCRKTNIMMPYSVLLMRRGEFEKARELMKEISKDKTMSEDTHYELRINYSVCLWRLGLLDKAIETIQYAGKTKKTGSYYSTLGTFLTEQAAATGNYEETKAFLDEALDYDDEDPETLDSLGELYRLMSRDATPEEAEALRKQSIEYYEKALEQKPGQVTTLYALAQYERENGNTARAKELIDKALIYHSSRVCPVTKEMLLELQAQL